jgi:NDP-sugar pyrophosphorylase family protein
MTVFRNNNRWDASNVLFEGGCIRKYHKRDRIPAMQHIDYGIGALSAAALSGYPDNAPFDLASVYQDLLARGVLAAYEVTARFYEIGTPQGLEETRAYLASRPTGHS